MTWILLSENAVDNVKNGLKKTLNVAVQGRKLLVKVKVEETVGVNEDQQSSGNNNTHDEQSDCRAGKVPDKEEDQGKRKEESKDSEQNAIYPSSYGSSGDINNNSSDDGGK